jgi:alcohol dehydrogenase (cytochrome c)
MRYRLLAATLLLGAASLQAQSQVTFDRILHADREPQNWLTYSGGLFGHRYSPLTQITPANVKTRGAPA